MKTLVIYDIVSDKIRNKVFEACKDYGLEHIQYSAFFGELNQNLRQELGQRLGRILGKHEGKIFVCPVCDKDIRLLLEIKVQGETIVDEDQNPSHSRYIEYPIVKKKKGK